MLTPKQETTLNRIISGCIYCQIDKNIFLIKNASPYTRYLAEHVYQDIYEECNLQGLYTDEQRLEMLSDKGFWSKDEAKLLESLKKEIKNFKHEIYRSFFKVAKRKVLKKAIETAQRKIGELLIKQGRYYQDTCEGRAGIAKLKFILGSSVYNENGKPIFNHKLFWKETSSVLDKIVAFYNDNRISETDFRLISRSDEWRLYWNCRRAGLPLFNGSTLDITDEQRQLIYWSNLYDNIFESPDCPEDVVIADDDATDGFLIDQNNKRQERDREKQMDTFTENDRIKNAAEVFIVANSKDEISRVNDFNDDEAKLIKQQREKFIKDKGSVKEKDLPDVKRRLQMEMVQKQFGKK